MIILAVVILALYSILILAFIIGFNRVENLNTVSSPPTTSFSIVIPFRDEDRNLMYLLDSLSILNYPKELFEIILIDDVSTDNSVDIIDDFKHKNSKLNIEVFTNNRTSGSPKKDAIETAINYANFDWIVSTDADCKVPQNWLLIFNEHIQNHQPKLIAAPVTYCTTNSLLDQFQLLDLMSLQGATIGGFGIGTPFLCNGANLCYEKQAFLDINGFKGNKHIASGDDIFLLEKMKNKYPDKVHFSKSNEAIITTKPEATVTKLLSQRIRWAAKATSYTNNFSKLVSMAVFSMNILLIILFFGCLLSYYSWLLFVIAFIIKVCLDFILLLKTATFFNQHTTLKHYFWSSIIYPFFTIFIALSSFTSGYSWKGRTYKK